jgi:hypothetical protein
MVALSLLVGCAGTPADRPDRPTGSELDDPHCGDGTCAAVDMAGGPPPADLSGPLDLSPPPSSGSNQVVPVLVVASDFVNDPAAIQAGVASFTSVVTYVRDWYAAQVGHGYAIGAVRIVSSSRSAKEWVGLSNLSADSAHRYDYFNAVDDLVAPITVTGNRYTAAVYAGAQPDVWLGAASADNVAVGTPRATSISCPLFSVSNTPPVDARCADAVYGTGHELGHTFGLAHSCDAYPSDPSCDLSMMQTGKPPSAILLPGEIATLRSTAFFVY